MDMNSVAKTGSIRAIVKMPISLREGRNAQGELISFNGLSDNREHFAIRLGKPNVGPTLVRVHSECITGDVFGSRRCDCGAQLQEAIHQLDEAGGYILYLRQEGRGIGLYKKLDAYLLQERGADTFEANRLLGHANDERTYQVAAEILRALGLHEIDLITNNPEKIRQLEDAGITVRARIPTGVFLSDHNRMYLEAKACQSGHALNLPPRRE
jgi:GTP cyclohydrolase II